MSISDHIAELALRAIREDIEAYRENISSGSCADFSQYQNLCGRIRGLLQAEEYIQALLKKASTDDDDD
jgi:hypothetical protein